MANLWLTGSGEPTLGTGTMGDYYRDTVTNIVYFRENPTTWVVVPAFTPNPDGVGTTWIHGTGAPLNTLGSDTNYYYDDADKIVYYKDAGTWTPRGSLDFIGVYGVQWGNGSGAPANTPQLNDLPAGSFYLDVSTSDIYYKNLSLQWELKGQLGGGIVDYTWATKPSVAPLGQIICVTDVGENGSLWRGNGTKWIKLHAVKYYNNTTPVSLTGTTAETTMLTIPVKGGLIGANGVLAIQPLWSNTNNANTKTLRIKLGATTCYSYGTANLSHQDAYINVRNIGSESSQKTTSGMSGGTGGTVNNYNSTSTDTSVNFNIVVTGQLANSADTMAIQAFLIMVL